MEGMTEGKILPYVFVAEKTIYYGFLGIPTFFERRYLKLQDNKSINL